jgi:hypothetical protein
MTYWDKVSVAAKIAARLARLDPGKLLTFSMGCITHATDVIRASAELEHKEQFLEISKLLDEFWLAYNQGLDSEFVATFTDNVDDNLPGDDTKRPLAPGESHLWWGLSYALSCAAATIGVESDTSSEAHTTADAAYNAIFEFEHRAIKWGGTEDDLRPFQIRCATCRQEAQFQLDYLAAIAREIETPFRYQECLAEITTSRRVEDDYLRKLAHDPTNRALLDAFKKWLEERGDPRSVFIGLDFVTLEESDRPIQAMPPQQRELVEEARARWTAMLAGLDIPPQAVAFYKGVPQEVSIEDFDLFLDNAEAIFEACPSLTSITFNNAVNVVTGSRLDVQRLAGSANLTGLRSIRFLSCALGPDGITVLANSPHFRAIKCLTVAQDAIQDQGAAGIGAGAGLSELGSLMLLDNEIGPAGAQALASSTKLEKLSELSVINNPLGDAGVKALASSPHLTSLEALVLSSVNMTSEGANALASSSHLKRLTKLVITDASLDEVSKTALRTRFGKGLDLG